MTNEVIKSPSPSKHTRFLKKFARRNTQYEAIKPIFIQAETYQAEQQKKQLAQNVPTSLKKLQNYY